MQYAPITKIMSDTVVTVTLGTPFVKLQEMMKNYLIHHIPVIDDEGKLCGIVSRNDLVREYICYLKESPGIETFPNLMAKDIMVADVISVKDTADIKQTAEIMMNHEFHSAPVINTQQHVVGIVTSADLIEHLIKL